MKLLKAMERSLITAPASEPIRTAEAKSHARIDTAADDTLIGTYIVAAREDAELFTRRALVTQTWDVYIDRFPCDEDAIELPLPPVQSLTHIKYLDADNVEQTLATTVYELVADAGPAPGFALVLLKPDQSWPSTREHPHAVRIRQVCGYGEAADVPAKIKLAIETHVAESYNQREESNTGTSVALASRTVRMLLWPFRAMR
jgi:uncharacterized phiE125 gp8 family phage protein